jgi:hypothetical protein
MLESFDRDRQIAQYAESLFERALRQGKFRRFWSRLAGKNRHLPLLRDVRQRHKDIRVLPPQHKSIRVSQIVGTAGALGFDCDFLPYDQRDRSRWVSVARAMLRDSLTLPPIKVVQVGEDYFVVDGHHRVSVARILQRLYLDAEVTRWRTSP